MNKPWKIVLGIVLAIAVSVCGYCVWYGPRVDAGVVVDKTFVPAHDVYNPPTYIQDGSGGGYWTAGYTSHYPDDWDLKIDTDGYEDKPRVRWVDVTGDDYRAHAVGAEWFRRGI